LNALKFFVTIWLAFQFIGFAIANSCDAKGKKEKIVGPRQTSDRACFQPVGAISRSNGRGHDWQ